MIHKYISHEIFLFIAFYRDTATNIHPTFHNWRLTLILPSTVKAMLHVG